MGARPKVISTFAGCGGSSLGYKMAGFDELLAVDWDENARDTFKRNFPETPFWFGDISKLSVEEVLETCGIAPGELDVFDGSPPCQGFSMAGKRDVGDSRSQLFLEFKRLLDGLRPRAFVMENVPSMATGTMKGTFNDIFRALSENYEVRAKVLNAADYGVPQARRRMIFIGYRRDLGLTPSFPAPDKAQITLGEALAGVPSGEKKYPRGKLAKFTPLTRPGEAVSKRHPLSHHFNTSRASMHRPAPTVTKTFGDSLGGLLHPEEDRFFTIPELKRACSFPDDFEFEGSFTEQWARMGNAVMPVFMSRVAAHVKEALEGVPRK